MSQAQPTVLVAEENQTLRRILTGVLERAGYLVLVADDGVQAVQLAARVYPDAVITDVRLSRLSGYVVARVLKDDPVTCGIPVIVVGEAARGVDRYHALHAGADRFFSRDFEVPELLDATRELVSFARANPPVPGRDGRAGESLTDAGLGDEDVFARAAAVLDRRLLESAIVADATAVGVRVGGPEETMAEILGLLGRIADVDLAAVLTVPDHVAYISVLRECSRQQYADFFSGLAEAATAIEGTPVTMPEIEPQVADSEEFLGAEDDGAMLTFLPVPLRHRGELVGMLAVSSAAPQAVDERTARLVGLVVAPAAPLLVRARR